jgi:hypothetical protein
MHAMDLKISEMTDLYKKHHLKVPSFGKYQHCNKCNDEVISTKTLLFLLPYSGPILNMCD